MIRNPERISTWLRLVNTARNLERIANHAVKIAESVIYLKEGEIMRHYRSHALPKADVVASPTSAPSTIITSD